MVRQALWAILGKKMRLLNHGQTARMMPCLALNGCFSLGLLRGDML
jgi:hypothetical protein